jgi:hypothetical protein
LAFSPFRVFVFASPFLLPVLTRSTVYQSPVPGRDENELNLAPTQERDLYEIDSLPLKAEMPPQWNITALAIRQETQTHPNFGATYDSSPAVCLQPTLGQESVYRPLIEAYLAKNRKKPVLRRKFDLPEYAPIGPAEIVRTGLL